MFYSKRRDGRRDERHRVFGAVRSRGDAAWLKGFVRITVWINKFLFRYVLSAAVVAFCSSALFPQTPIPSPVSNTPIQKIDYSQSVPYEPHVFQPAKDSKDKKKSKNEKPSSGPTLTNKIGSADGLLTIPVSVFMSNDTIVNGLAKADLKVFISEEEQTIISVEADKPLNLVLLLDVSPSTDSRIKEIKDIATQIVGDLRPDDKVMIAAFSADMKILVDFTTDRKLITKAISKAKMNDGTALYDAISDLLRKRLSLTDGTSSMIVLSDGIDTVSRRSSDMRSLVDAERGNAAVFPIHFDTFEDQIKNAKKVPKYLISILGTTQGLPTEQEREMGINYFNDLINLSGGRGISTNPSSNKTAIHTTISTWLRGQYFVTIKPLLTVKSGSRLPMQVRVNRPNLTVLAKGSYMG